MLYIALTYYIFVLYYVETFSELLTVQKKSSLWGKIVLNSAVIDMSLANSVKTCFSSKLGQKEHVQNPKSKFIKMYFSNKYIVTCFF